MSNKRPFYDEEAYEVVCKNPRQEGLRDHLSANIGTACKSDSSLEQFSAFHQNKAWDNGEKTQCEGTFDRGVYDELVIEPQRELEVKSLENTSNYSPVNENAVDKYSESADKIPLPFTPHFFEIDHRVMSVVQPQNIYSSLLEQPPKMLVSVGPYYQADIPDLALDNNEYISHMAGAELAGTRVISMSDTEASEYYHMQRELNKYCYCPDRDSIQCVKKHVNEAREALKENLGSEVFEELGFRNMGDDVAKLWTEEEELMFHEVVDMNPASQGKNFWHNLSNFFPLKPKRDLVSYYFNVFVLRKRAEQNRFDPLHVDSDYDEWRICDDDGSGVESVDADEEGSLHDQEDHEDDEREDMDDVFQFQGKGLSNNDREDRDIQDESCTSYENQNTTKVHSDGPSDLGIGNGDDSI